MIIKEILLNKHQPLLNEQINITAVRVVGDDGTQHGIMSSKEAQNLATSKNVDLVLIVPDSNPPVCKIIDWGKHQFAQKKRAKESKNKQTTIDVKEIQLRPAIDPHDLETKLNRVRKFLAKGKHVRFSMRFRGRENSHTEIGMNLMKDVLKTLGDGVIVEKPPVLSGNTIIMIVTPLNK